MQNDFQTKVQQSQKNEQQNYHCDNGLSSYFLYSGSTEVFDYRALQIIDQVFTTQYVPLNVT